MTSHDIPIDIAKDIVAFNILQEHGIAGVGIGNPRPVINIYVEDEDMVERVPEELVGYQTRVIVTGGPFRIHSTFDPISRDSRVRPLVGGISIGFGDLTGTLGVMLRDATTGIPKMLSNNHVMAASNQRPIGSPIYQPSPSVNQSESQLAAALEKFKALVAQGEGTNVMDAAIANPVPTVTSTPDTLLGANGEMIEIPGFSGTPAIDDEVAAATRSGYKESTLIDTHASVTITDFPWGNSVFVNQLIMSPAISQSGDSGSALIDKESRNLIGLIFAGSATTSIANRIVPILNEFNLTVAGKEPGENGEEPPPPGTPRHFWAALRPAAPIFAIGIAMMAGAAISTGAAAGKYGSRRPGARMSKSEIDRKIREKRAEMKRNLAGSL